MSDQWIVIGGGGHARVIIGILKRQYGDQIRGYTDRVDQGTMMGVPFLGTDDYLINLVNKDRYCLAIAIGSLNPDMAKMRETIVARFLENGFLFPAIIAPTAVVADSAKIAGGAFIGDGAVVNPGSIIGQGAIINTGVIVEHDCKIGKWSHLAPGATLSGDVNVGDYCHIGSGATIINQCLIADRAVVGAGATVVSDLSEAGTYLGTPAKKVD